MLAFFSTRNIENPDNMCDQESPTNLMEMLEELINVARSIYHGQLVWEMVRNIGLKSFIVNPSSFASETLNFRGTWKSPSMNPLIRKDDDKPVGQLKVDNKTNDISYDQIDETYFYIFHMKDQDEISLNDAPVANNENTLTNLHHLKELTDVHCIIYTRTIEEVTTIDGGINNKIMNDSE